MVVHEESDNISVVEPEATMSNKESKKFLIVNNHVREIPIQYKENSTFSDSEKNAEENISKNKRKKMMKKMHRKRMKSLSKNKSIREELKRTDAAHETTIISESDIEELRTVYKKCKAVVQKIESKYGHLLDSDMPSSSKQRRIMDQETECTCETNKRIVFDDDGQQISVDATTEIHICPKKSTPIDNHRNIEIEYMDNEAQLPDSLQELYKLLKNPDIKNTLRHRIIYKIKCIKEEVLNDIKFNKQALMEKLKSNPDEVLGFEGTNLASIPGYQ